MRMVLAVAVDAAGIDVEQHVAQAVQTRTAIEHQRGIRTGLYNLGTGYTTLFLGQSYRVTGNTVYPPDSGLTTRFSDFVGEIEIVPGRLFDIDYRFELANDLKTDRLQEVNFRVGPDNYGIFGTYLFAGQVSIPSIAGRLRPSELSLIIR